MPPAERLARFQEYLYIDGEEEKLHERQAFMLRYVTGYYDFSYRRGLKLVKPLD